MDLKEFHGELKKVEARIIDSGLIPEVVAHFNWVGEEIAIIVGACERFEKNGRWTSSREFAGSPDNVEKLLDDVNAWVSALPSAEDRAIEFMIRKLHEISEQLPEGGSDVAKAAWKEIHNMLMAKAEHLAKNGLPSPARITEISA